MIWMEDEYCNIPTLRYIRRSDITDSNRKHYIGRIDLVVLGYTHNTEFYMGYHKKILSIK